MDQDQRISDGVPSPSLHNMDQEQWIFDQPREPTGFDNTQQYQYPGIDSHSTTIEGTSSSYLSSTNTSLATPATTLSDFLQHHVEFKVNNHVPELGCPNPSAQNLNALVELPFGFDQVYFDTVNQGMDWQPHQVDPFSMLPPKPTFNHLSFQQDSVSAQLAPSYPYPTPEVQYEYNARFRVPGAHTTYVPLPNTFRVDAPPPSTNLRKESHLHPGLEQNQGPRVPYNAEMYDALHTDLAAMDGLLLFHEAVHFNPPPENNEDVQYLWSALNQIQNGNNLQFPPSMQSANSILTTQPQLPIHSSRGLKRSLAQEPSGKLGNQYGLNFDASSHLAKRLRTSSEDTRNLASSNVVEPLQISNTQAKESRPPGLLIAPKTPALSNVDNVGNQSNSMCDQCPSTSKIVDGIRGSRFASLEKQIECFGCLMRGVGCTDKLPTGKCLCCQKRVRRRRLSRPPTMVPALVFEPENTQRCLIELATHLEVANTIETPRASSALLICHFELQRGNLPPSQYSDRSQPVALIPTPHLPSATAAHDVSTNQCLQLEQMLQFMHRATLEVLPRDLRIAMTGVPSACLQFIAWSNFWCSLDECHVYCSPNVSSYDSKMCLQGLLSSTIEALQNIFDDIVLKVNQAPAESSQATRILLALELLHRFFQRPMLSSTDAPNMLDRILNDLKEAGNKQAATIRKSLKSFRLNYGAYFCPESEDVLLKCLEIVPLLNFKLNLTIEKHKPYILGFEDLPSIHPRSFKEVLMTNRSPMEDYLWRIKLHDIPKSKSCDSSNVDHPKLSYNGLCTLQKHLGNFTNNPRPREARYVAPRYERSIPTGRRASIVALSEPRDPSHPTKMIQPVFI